MWQVPKEMTTTDQEDKLFAKIYEELEIINEQMTRLESVVSKLMVIVNKRR